MAVILSMLASVSGEITTGTLLISPVGSSSAMTISDQLQSPWNKIPFQEVSGTRPACQNVRSSSK